MLGSSVPKPRLMSLHQDAFGWPRRPGRAAVSLRDPAGPPLIAAVPPHAAGPPSGLANPNLRMHPAVRLQQLRSFLPRLHAVRMPEWKAN